MRLTTKYAGVLALSLLLRAAAFASDPWTVPTAEELSMTTLPQAPGVGAIFLYREQKYESSFVVIHTRIKVLNESGKEYATIELPAGGVSEIHFDDIAGRTIHSDGTIIPFTGKPYEKLVEKDQGHKYKIKVFSLPSVEVGSILEYRYRISSNYSGAPDWFLQSELYTRKVSFSWVPEPGIVAWAPILPAGVSVRTETKSGLRYSLEAEEIKPLPRDPMMPPLNSSSYRVLFYYTRYKNATDFWTDMGDIWTKSVDKYVGPGNGVRAAVTGMVTTGDNDEQKVRRIYAYVMAMENTEFTRQLTEREAKAQGVKDSNNTDDVLARRRGNSSELTMLFVAMVRAAGLKAYIMRVVDRSERMFLAAYLSTRQASDYIAIVNLGGKDIYFDPGQRYSPCAHLAWYHSLAGGQRQTETGTALVSSPISLSQDNHISRVADLTLDEHGAATGYVVLTYTGDPARSWRQRALVGDDTSLKADLKSELERMLPSGTEITVTKMGDFHQTEEPLVITFDVHGTVGSATGRRLVLPAFLFANKGKPIFQSDKRESPVDLHFGSYTQDAVRYKLPAGMEVESAPADDKNELKGAANFSSSSKTGTGEIVFFRNVFVGRVLYPTTEYGGLRSFYQKLELRDQEQLVLARKAAVESKGSN